MHTYRKPQWYNVNENFVESRGKKQNKGGEVGFVASASITQALRHQPTAKFLCCSPPPPKAPISNHVPTH